MDAPAQFITTTFRPELVAVAQKCYGIALENKVSNIYPLEKSEAQRFVLALMNEEEAVGVVSQSDNYGANKLRKQVEENTDELGEQLANSSLNIPDEEANMEPSNSHQEEYGSDEESEDEDIDEGVAVKRSKAQAEASKKGQKVSDKPKGRQTGRRGPT